MTGTDSFLEVNPEPRPSPPMPPCVCPTHSVSVSYLPSVLLSIHLFGAAPPTPLNPSPYPPLLPQTSTSRYPTHYITPHSPCPLFPLCEYDALEGPGS